MRKVSQLRFINLVTDLRANVFDSTLTKINAVVLADKSKT